MSVSHLSRPFLLPDGVPDTFEINRERAIDYLNTRDNVYVFDGFAGVSRPRPLPCLPAHFYSSVASQVPHQGPGHLCPCLSCPVHGSFYRNSGTLPDS